MQTAARAIGVLATLAFVGAAFVISSLACMDVSNEGASRCATDSFMRFGATSLAGAAAALIGVWLLPRRPFIAAAGLVAAAGVGFVLLIMYGFFVSSLRVFWQAAAVSSAIAAALALTSGVRGEPAVQPGMPAAKNRALAAVLSALIIGVGHWYLGRWRRALAWEGGLFGLALAFTLLDLPDSALSTIGLGLSAASGADAWRIATAANAEREAALPRF